MVRHLVILEKCHFYTIITLEKCKKLLGDLFTAGLLPTLLGG